ncbi:RNA methyltransferase, partial [Klebsiella pneumoniae]|nr:RNA methyltransferase [Klebsiella pneumoniae]
VDVYNGKAVRASTGSVFHLPVARSRDVADVLVRCREAGLQLVGADGYANRDLHVAEDAGALRQPTAWVFGSEAHGLPDEVKTQLDFTLRVPLYGRAESLNLATAAAVSSTLPHVSAGTSAASSTWALPDHCAGQPAASHRLEWLA